MIDFNKTSGKPQKCVSIKVSTPKQAHAKKIKKLTRANKNFLKLIGLLK